MWSIMRNEAELCIITIENLLNSENYIDSFVADMLIFVAQSRSARFSPAGNARLVSEMKA